MTLLDRVRHLGPLRVALALPLLLGVPALSVLLAWHALGDAPPEGHRAAALGARLGAGVDGGLSAVRLLASVGGSLSAADARALTPAAAEVLERQPALRVLGWMARPATSRRDAPMTIAPL